MAERLSVAALRDPRQLGEMIARNPDSEQQAVLWHSAAEMFEADLNYSKRRDMAAFCYGKAVDLVTDPEERAIFSSHYSLALVDRAESGESAEADLKLATDVAKVAVDLTPREDPSYKIYLANYGDVKIRLAQRNRSPEGIDEGIGLLKEAIALSAEGDGDDEISQLWYAKLRQELYNRAESTGRITHLEEALEIFERNPIEWLDKADRHWFAVLLQNRHLLTGSTLDLNKAIEILEGLSRLQPDNENHGALLVLLGNCRRMRARRTNSEPDCDRSIALFEDALQWLGQHRAFAPHDRAICLGSKASTLVLRYHIKGLDDLPYDPNAPEDDLGTAVRLYTEVRRLNPDGPTKGNLLGTLGAALNTRYRKTRSPGDLNDAISAFNEALSLQSSEFHAQTLASLGLALQNKATESESESDWELAIDAYERGTACLESPVQYRIMAADDGGRCIWKRDPQRANRLFETAVNLLPALSPRSLMLADQQKNLIFFDGVVWSAVSSCLETTGDVYKAIHLAEAGRGIIANLQLNISSDMSELELEHPSLASRFSELRNSLGAISPNWEDDPSSRFGSANDIRSLTKKFMSVLDEIKDLDAFKDFLGCPKESELMNMAKTGPLVIFSVSEIRSDALLITSKGLRHVQLSKLKYNDVLHYAQEFLQAITAPRISQYAESRKKMKRLLEWLWDVAISEVLQELGFTETPQTQDEWSQIWWVRAGVFSLFPLHAAGYHESEPRVSVLDRVISSYTTTLKSLLFARRAKHANVSVNPNVLVVGMPTTPGQDDLSVIRQEMDELAQLFPAAPTTHFKTNPDRDDVYPILKDTDVFHFSGHGMSSATDPSLSSILLNDWQTKPLTVASLRSLQIDRGEFTYLSACHSASSANVGLRLLDESIHVSSAFQLAGFRRIVATLWYAYGDHAVVVAKDLYCTMQDQKGKLHYDCAASALHHAVRSLRDRLRQIPGIRKLGPDDPLAWAVYIYTGA